MCTRIRLPIVLALSAMTSACGLSSDYPSLAPRPEELGQSPQPKAAATAPLPPDPQLAPMLDKLLASAQSGDAAFRAAAARTEQVVERAGGEGSDSWIEAQLALSRLESARTPTTVAAAELETLTRTRIEEAPSAAKADVGAIMAAADQVRTLIDAQDQVIDRLNGVLRRR